MVGVVSGIGAHGFDAFSEGGFGPGFVGARRACAPEFVRREDDVAVCGVAGEDVAVLVGAEDGEGAEEGCAVVVVGDGFQGFIEAAAGGERFYEIFEALPLTHGCFPEEV